MRHLLIPALFLPTLLITSAPQGTATAQGSAPAGGPQLGITQSTRQIRSLPFTIDEPGSYRVVATLTGTAGDSGITVASSDVTINLAGYALLADPASLDGILIEPGNSRVTIREGNLVGWTNGINGLDGTEIRVTSVNVAQSSANGITVGRRSRVENCTAVGSGTDGIVASDQGTVSGCAVQGQGAHGIRLGLGGLIIDCQARDCGDAGIQGGPTSIIRGCRAEQNGDEGIRNVEGGHVVDSIALNNGTVGIRVNGRSIVRGCTAFGNTLRGIEAQDASMVHASVATANGQAGVFINAFGIARDNISHTNQNGVVSRLGIARNNLTIGSLENGIVSHDGDMLQDNLILRNGLRGILVNSNDTRIENNHLIENPVGIRALQPTVTIFKNSLSDNTTNFQLGAGTDQGAEIEAGDDDAFGNILN